MPRPHLSACFALLALSSFGAAAPVELSAPPQDQGLPYTRSARTMAMARIKDHIAVFAGSRYAYVRGYKVRLDEADWRAEAALREGRVLVPAAFAGVLLLTAVQPEPAPAYLADRWVYSLRIPALAAPTVKVEGRPFVALAEEARRLGLTVSQHPRGLLLIGTSEVSFQDADTQLLEAIITQFDTPEKFADPDIATRFIPTLRRQGRWTDHVKITPEQQRILDGPETVWPTTPESQYDFSGLNQALLGTKVPPPGVYPRVLFSPDDVAPLAARLQRTKAGQRALIEMEYLLRKSWWDPATSDGKLLTRLVAGDAGAFEWTIPNGTPPGNYPQLKGHTPGIYNSHVAYIPECLTAMALYSLLTGDDNHGRQAAAAIASYYRLRESQLDELNAISDSEFGSAYRRADGTLVAAEASGGATHWRTVAGLMAHMNLGLALDFSGKWMTPAEKDDMRRIIAKATYGRRAYGQDAPVRFADVNWVTWDLPHLLALLAIEGLEGFDREGFEANRAVVRAYCDCGIDPAGVVFESNGKTPGGFQFQLLSMVALARRGENLFGHPHWRRLMRAQALMTSPSGRVVVNSGTQYAAYSEQQLSPQFVNEWLAFYPGDRDAAYLLGRARQLLDLDENYREWVLDDFDPAAFRSQVARLPHLRLPSPTYPGLLVHGVLYDADFAPTPRAELKLPLDFSDPVQGVFSSYSDRGDTAAWINMMVRPNHYLGAGHHHADAGMFHYSALGVDWFTQSPFTQAYDGKYFNLVQIDGRSEAENMPGFANGYNAAASYLGMTAGTAGAAATADLTYAYSYRWLTQPALQWPKEIKAMGWEMDPSPEILRIFAGTARYKMRPWWPNYNYSNYIATCRAAFNPMQHVYRTVGLVRGKHPYGFVVDDVKKDENRHLYQWAAMLRGGVWQAEVPGLPPNQIALAFRAPEAPFDSRAPKRALRPRPGEPLLLVCALGPDDSGDPVLPRIEIATLEGPPDRANKPQYYDRLVINQRAVTANFRVLLVPLLAGQSAPQITVDSNRAVVAWPDQVDRFGFTLVDSRTRTTVHRDNETVLTSP